MYVLFRHPSELSEGLLRRRVNESVASTVDGEPETAGEQGQNAHDVIQVGV